MVTSCFHSQIDYAFSSWRKHRVPRRATATRYICASKVGRCAIKPVATRLGGCWLHFPIAGRRIALTETDGTGTTDSQFGLFWVEVNTSTCLMEKEFTAAWLKSHMVWLIKTSTAQTDGITVCCFVFQGGSLETRRQNYVWAQPYKRTTAKWGEGAPVGCLVVGATGAVIVQTQIHVLSICMSVISVYYCFPPLPVFMEFFIDLLSQSVYMFFLMLFLDPETALLLLLLLGGIGDLQPSWVTTPKALCAVPCSAVSW